MVLVFSKVLWFCFNHSCLLCASSGKTQGCGLIWHFCLWTSKCFTMGDDVVCLLIFLYRLKVLVCYFVIDAHEVRTKNSLCITLNVVWIFLCNLIDMYVASVELWTLLLKWNLVKWIFLHISWIYNDMLCWIPGPDRAMDWLLSLGDCC
jgi:hypothetical protein